MEVTSFAEIEQEFQERITRMVWCNVATLDTRNRLRSRILHPIWEGPVGWIGTRRDSHKAKHLAHHPYVSLAYIADIVNPVYVDCSVAWDDNLDTKQRIWNLFLNTPQPLGYDPAPIFGSIENFGLLRLTPWRVELYDAPASGERRVWRSERG